MRERGEERRGRGGGLLTEERSSHIAKTNFLESVDSVRIVSVLPCSNTRVRAVSYVAVNVPLVRYHASCMAICTQASGDRRAV